MIYRSSVQQLGRSAAADELSRLKLALQPSGETKAAYSGEFYFYEHLGFDEDGQEMPAKRVAVPWTTVKEIMAAIAKRADSKIEPERWP